MLLVVPEKRHRLPAILISFVTYLRYYLPTSN